MTAANIIVWLVSWLGPVVAAIIFFRVVGWALDAVARRSERREVGRGFGEEDVTR